jgi:hypothetical protein
MFLAKALVIAVITEQRGVTSVGNLVVDRIGKSNHAVKLAEDAERVISTADPAIGLLLEPAHIGLPTLSIAAG